MSYFSPELEVPFCGHATIALGRGAGFFPLRLNHAEIRECLRAMTYALDGAAN